MCPPSVRWNTVYLGMHQIMNRELCNVQILSTMHHTLMYGNKGFQDIYTFFSAIPFLNHLGFYAFLRKIPDAN